MKVKERSFFSGVFQDRYKTRYEEALTIPDMREILRQAVSDGSRILGCGVDFDHDHSDIEEPKAYKDFEEMLKNTAPVRYKDIHQIVVNTQLGDDFAVSHVFYPDVGLYVREVINQKTRDEIAKIKKKEQEGTAQ